MEQTDVFEDWGCVGLMGNDDKDEAVVKYAWSGYGVNALVSYSFAKNAEKLDGAYYIDEEADMDYQVSAALGYATPDILFGPIDVRATPMVSLPMSQTTQSIAPLLLPLSSPVF